MEVGAGVELSAGVVGAGSTETHGRAVLWLSHRASRAFAVHAYFKRLADGRAFRADQKKLGRRKRARLFKGAANHIHQFVFVGHVVERMFETGVEAETGTSGLDFGCCGRHEGCLGAEKHWGQLRSSGGVSVGLPSSGST